MIQIQLEADVPASRQVTVTLPPEVPTGWVRLIVEVEPANPAPAGIPRLKAIIAQPEPEIVVSGQVRVYDSEPPV